MIEPPHLTQIRHNSHPLHINQNFESYVFDMKASKFAHSDGTLDTCNNHYLDEMKNNSCSALIQQHHNETLDEQMKRINLKNFPNIDQIWYYGNISREEAENYLKLHGSDQGDFLIRDSERRVKSIFISLEIYFFALLFSGWTLFSEYSC